MSQAFASDKKEFAQFSLGMWETFFWIQTVQVGVGVLSLPRQLAEQAGHTGWMALPLAGLGVQLALWMMVILMRRFDPLDVFDIFRLLFGKWLGNMIGGLFMFYCVIACGVVVRNYVELVQTWLFPTTSTTMFYLLLLVPVFYLGRSNARVLGRYGIVAFFSTVWMGMLMFRPLAEVNIDLYLPLLDITPFKLLNAVLASSHSVGGYEVLLVFYPFIQNKKKALKVMSAGIWFTIVIYLYITLIAFGFYSQGQIQSLIVPTVDMMQIVQLPMIERTEHIGIAAWSLLVVSTAASYIWAGGRYFRNFKRWDKFTPLILLGPLLWLGYWPREMYNLQKFSLFYGYLGAIVAFLIPSMSLLVAKIRGIQEPPKPSQEEEKVAS